MLAVNLFISGSEIFIILLVVLLLFGANKLPEIARGLGKGMNEFKRATRDIRSEFDEQTKDIQKDVKELKKDIEDQTRFNFNDDFFDESGEAEDISQSGSKEHSTGNQTGHQEESTHQEWEDEATDQPEEEGNQSDQSEHDETRPPDDPYGLNQEDERQGNEDSSRQ